MKTTYVITLEHKAPLPADFIKAMADRPCSLPQLAIDTARYVRVQTLNDWLNERALVAIGTDEDIRYGGTE